MRRTIAIFLASETGRSACGRRRRRLIVRGVGWRADGGANLAQVENAFSKARLEAFSDGVIAVIITIMVLDLKPPASADPADLFKLWPSFVIYFVSFTFVAIYWINHHAILTAAHHATPSLIWANNSLLFCLSLVPFSTAYVGATNLAQFPTMIYAALQLACGLAFKLTFATIVAQRRNDPEFMAGERARRIQNGSALTVYFLSIGVAWLSPISALALFIAVAVAYVVPGLFADRPMPR
ncbi:MAG: DUF1211 domain-containing protein [Bradyrhizobium sp.]|nr:MAG: DUF1211 domain-containing protein [Bradyrhizobium sp.]